MNVYRWDLDKTYLQTEFGSMRSLLKTALETAAHKRNVPGSAALLRALQKHDPRSRVTIVSGSPKQMRSVIEEKLALDGIRYDSLILKDNLGNLRRGRLRAVRGQLGYKLPALLEARASEGADLRETLFGDDAEVDAVVYALYADACAGRVQERNLIRIMKAGGAYSDAIDRSIAALRRIDREDTVRDIFIVLQRGLPIQTFRSLSGRVIPVFSWIQAAFVLYDRGALSTEGVAQVTNACMASTSWGMAGLGGLAQDLVRRRCMSAESVSSLIRELPGLTNVETVDRAVRRLQVLPSTQRIRDDVDFIGLLRDFS